MKKMTTIKEIKEELKIQFNLKTIEKSFLEKLKDITDCSELQKAINSFLPELGYALYSSNVKVGSTKERNPKHWIIDGSEEFLYTDIREWIYYFDKIRKDD